jgi:hypothetical protein
MFMAWQTIGRPAGLYGRERDQRRREYDRRFGSNSWRVMHVLAGEVLEPTQAWRLYQASYQQFFETHPAILDWLCDHAADVYANAVSNVRSGLEYQIQERKREHIADIAIRNAIKELGRELKGETLVCIGGARPDLPALHPGQVPFCRQEQMEQPILRGYWQPGSVECFWQSNRILQVWTER